MSICATHLSPPEIPKSFWEDFDWGLDHLSEWMPKHPDQWVAVVNKKIVSSANDIETARSDAREKTGQTHIPVLFIEGKIHVY